MTDPIEKTKDAAAAAAHPVDTAKELTHEAEEGRSARTPAIALTGITLIVGAIAAVILAIAFLAYFLA